jgi:hypothetical protein
MNMYIDFCGNLNPIFIFNTICVLDVKIVPRLGEKILILLKHKTDFSKDRNEEFKVTEVLYNYVDNTVRVEVGC